VYLKEAIRAIKKGAKVQRCKGALFESKTID